MDNGRSDVVNTRTSLLQFSRRLAMAAALFTAFSVHALPVDAPELAVAGSNGVGLKRLTIDAGQVIDIDKSASGMGNSRPATSRTLNAQLWYPSQAPSATPREVEREVKNHAWRGLTTGSIRIAEISSATVDAPPVASGRLPVVILSHGLLGWASAMSYLAEHLASRGYAVLGIDHDDERASDPLKAALYLRSVDQSAAFQALQKINTTPGNDLYGRLDMERIAVIGYSMGGYGALISAGARVAVDGAAFSYVPHLALSQHAATMSAIDEQFRSRIGAIVVISPWGGQPAFGAFKPAGLKDIVAPSMTIVGDQDDVSGYSDGVRPIWDNLTGSQRWLLVYENARHNIGMQGAPLGMRDSFRMWEAFEEPVWRRDRILDVNRHFVTAFLDLTIRKQTERAQWLTVATPRSNDGAWPVAFGTPANGKFAGPPKGSVTQWTGFQRRWAVGLKLEQRAAIPKP